MARRKIGVVGNELYHAVIYRDPEWNEFVVRFYEYDELMKESDLFTDDKQDAFNSARAAINMMMDRSI